MMSMKKIRHRRLSRVLYRQCNGNYVEMLKWLKGSKTYGDGTYNYELESRCSRCNKIKE